MRNKTNTYLDHLPGLWHMFLWYVPMPPIIYFTIDLIETNAIHILWICLPTLFLSLYSRICIGPALTDIILLILYFISTFMSFSCGISGKLEIMLLVFFVVFLLFFFKYSLPDILNGHLKMQR